MDNQSEIIIGVISGIFTSAILFVAAKLFQNSILPAIRQVVYRGVDVSGSWYWENRFETVAKMELKQYADRLDGTYTYVNTKNAVIKTYSIKGHIQDRFIQLVLKSNDQQKLGVLSYVFEVVGDGSQLKGCSSFYSTNTHEIYSERESFFRDAAVAKALAQELQIETQKFLSYLAITKSPPKPKTASNTSQPNDDSKPSVDHPTA